MPSVDGKWQIVADGALLFKALSDLLDNAIKFTPNGRKVVALIRAGAGGPQIEISDTGPGIDQNERDAVWQRFYRGSQSHKIAASGLGLGIVAEVVKLHEYNNHFDSIADLQSLPSAEVGTGTKVTLSCWRCT